jgi:hypothetical protein
MAIYALRANIIKSWSAATDQTPWPESASKLYRPSASRLSAKFVPTSMDRGCRVVSAMDLYGSILGFLDRSRSFQTHYFSENLVAPGMESGPLDLQPGTLTTRPQRRSAWGQTGQKCSPRPTFTATLTRRQQDTLEATRSRVTTQPTIVQPFSFKTAALRLNITSRKTHCFYSNEQVNSVWWRGDRCLFRKSYKATCMPLGKKVFNFWNGRFKLHCALKGGMRAGSARTRTHQLPPHPHITYHWICPPRHAGRD